MGLFFGILQAKIMLRPVFNTEKQINLIHKLEYLTVKQDTVRLQNHSNSIEREPQSCLISGM